MGRWLFAQVEVINNLGFFSKNREPLNLSIKNDVHRPSASHGWWLCCLLPLAYIVNCWQHRRALSFDYKLSAIVAVGLLLQSGVQMGRLYTSVGKVPIIRSIPSTVAATLIYVFLDQGPYIKFANQPMWIITKLSICRFHFECHQWFGIEIYIPLALFLRAPAHAQKLYVRWSDHRHARYHHVRFECSSQTGVGRGLRSCGKHCENEYDSTGKLTRQIIRIKSRKIDLKHQ